MKIAYGIKVVFIILSLALMIACGPVPYSYIDPDFKDYVTEFVFLSHKHPENLIVKWADLPYEIGTCTHAENGQKVIRIDRHYWATLCPSQKRAVLFHELGHCVLARQHAPQNARSYMAPVLADCQFYTDFVSELDNELFNL